MRLLICLFLTIAFDMGRLQQEASSLLLFVFFSVSSGRSAALDLLGEPSLFLKERLASWGRHRVWQGCLWISHYWRHFHACCSKIGISERVGRVLSYGGHMIWLTCLTPACNLMESGAIWCQPPIHRSFILLVEPPAASVSHLLLSRSGALKLLLGPLPARPLLFSVWCIRNWSLNLLYWLVCALTLDPVSFFSCLRRASG